MKIAVIGYSGSGKSTLAAHLADVYQIPLLHLDAINFKAGWQERPQAEVLADLRTFMAQPNWVIDGNYMWMDMPRRMQEADTILFFQFSRLRCLRQAYRRYRVYHGRVRTSIAPGCPEKFDPEFVRWILVDGRRRKYRRSYSDVVSRYRKKTVILRNPADVERFEQTVHLPEA